MQIGYARVSTKDQHLDLQLDALKSAGCDTIFSEIASGATADRQALTTLLAQVRTGDVVVIWKLDRLGRSLTHLVDVVTTLMAKGVGLKSLQDPLDTTTAQGRLVFNIFAALAEFERDLLRERTQAGLHAARARGRLGGRPKGLSAAAAKKAVAAEACTRKASSACATLPTTRASAKPRSTATCAIGGSPSGRTRRRHGHSRCGTSRSRRAMVRGTERRDSRSTR